MNQMYTLDITPPSCDVVATLRVHLSLVRISSLSHDRKKILRRFALVYSLFSHEKNLTINYRNCKCVFVTALHMRLDFPQQRFVIIVPFTYNVFV